MQIGNTLLVHHSPSEKRTYSEFMKLKNNWAYVELTCENDITRIVVTKNTTGCIDPSTYIEFTIAQNYPFQIPRVVVNGKTYTGTRRFCRLPVLQRCLERLNIQCPCCASIMQPSRWSPIMQLDSIILEILHLDTVKLKVKSVMMIEKVCGKKNIPQVIESLLVSFV